MIRASEVVALMDDITRLRWANERLERELEMMRSKYHGVCRELDDACERIVELES